MRLEYLQLPGVALLAALTACATQPPEAAWPGPLPLGSDLATYRAPGEDLAEESPRPEVPDPTGVLSLREALSAALLGNPDLAASSWEVRAQEARALQAGLLPNPEVGLEVEEFAGSGESTGFRAAEFTLGLGQLIELGGKRAKRVRVASLESDLAAWDYEIQRLDVFTQTAKAFVVVLAAQELLTLSEEMVGLSERVLETVAERVKAQSESPLEESKARVVLSTATIQRENAKRALEVARRQLAATWGSPSAVFERVTGDLGVMRPIPMAAQLDRLLEQSPDMARWLVEVEQRLAALDLERAGAVPDLTVGPGVKRINQFKDSTQYALVLGLSMPLPVFDRNQGGILEARRNLRKALEERRATEVGVRTALAAAYEALSSSYAEALALRNDVLPEAHRVFDGVREGYRQGKFEFLDVLDAQRTLFEARGQYIEALAAYHVAVPDVERLTGRSLDAPMDGPDPHAEETSDEE